MGIKVEKIILNPDNEDRIEFFVLEQTTVAGVDYLLVTDSEEGDGEALILKDKSKKEDTEAVYEIVSDDLITSFIRYLLKQLKSYLFFEPPPFSMVFMGLQGFPTATHPAGMSSVTTLPAPITALSPIVTPGSTQTFPPIHTLLPIFMGFAYSRFWLRSSALSG